MIACLAAIPWRGRKVRIVFDFDPRRNPQVNHAQAELARIFESLGAIVTLIELPPGPPSADGRPGKMGADDFIVARGGTAFRDLIAEQMKRPAAPRSLADYRGDMARARVNSIGKPGVYLDRSPTGAGKSTADHAALRRVKTSLTILPSHKNTKAAEKDMLAAGLDAVRYIPLDGESCQRYDEAETVMKVGLSPSSTICPKCPHKADCDYQATMKAVETADHRLACHKRAELSFEQIADGRQFISIHEDLTEMLRPSYRLGESHVGALSEVAALADATRHRVADTIGTLTVGEGERITSDRPTLQWFCEKLARVARQLREQLTDAAQNAAIELPQPVSKLPGVDGLLYDTIKREQIRPHGDAMRLCLDLAAGRATDLAVFVDTVKRRNGEETVHREIVAIRKTDLPANATVWISDATANADEIGILTGREVIDATPDGRLDRLHRVLQVSCDVTKRTNAETVSRILSAILDRFPDRRRVGVICHKCHKEAIEQFAARDATARIAKVDYFRSGESRGSNDWQHECDLLVCIGTPRVPPETLRARLVQWGKLAAACRDREWVRDWWSGRDEAGRRITIKTRAYRDHEWYTAHRAIVHAELIQAVGRARSNCEGGIPAVVVSAEPLGFPLWELPVLTPTEADVLAVVRRLADERLTPDAAAGAKGDTANEYLSDFAPCAPNPSPSAPVAISPLNSADIAAALGKDRRWVRRVLVSLREKERVQMIGQRGGWWPVDESTPPTAPPA
ncbi:MAG: hypothetical protein DCC68_22165 [Planctomycetota bacterium]|nr:MAG: hypothetical protein DCC68_22165 [Planctomycetota bacterium]